MRRFEYMTPKTYAEAAALSAKDGADVKAGGTDVLLLLKDRIKEPRSLVNLQSVESPPTLEVKGDELLIDARVTLTELSENQTVRTFAPALSSAAGHAATPQIRNMATVAGNLCQATRCWYYRNQHFDCLRKGGRECFAQEGRNEYHAILQNKPCCAVHPSNLAGPLLALGGSLEVLGASGERRTMKASALYPQETPLVDNSLRPGELVTSVRVPSSQQSLYEEVRHKQSYDWPLATLSAAQRGGMYRFVFGAVSPMPFRNDAVDKLLGEGRLEEAMAAILETAQPLRENAYKLTLVRTLARRVSQKLGISGSRRGSF